MIAEDVMVRQVVTARPNMAVGEAVRLLAENDVSALPVVNDDGMLLGIISEADLIWREEIDTIKHRSWWLEAITPGATLANEFAKSHGRRVEEIMSREVITAEEGTPLEEIATLLERHRIKRVPVTRQGKLVGIVSRSNLIQALATSRVSIGTTDSDRNIRFELLARLGKQRWTDSARETSS